jgi:hypothetical protein
MALEADPVAVAVVKLMADKDEWVGTAMELLKELGTRVDEDVRRFKTWPKQPQHLSRHLKRLAPVLRAEGIEVEDLPRTGGERQKRLFKNWLVNDCHISVTTVTGARKPIKPLVPRVTVMTMI